MRPASIFSDNMVLLRDRETCIFGEGAMNEQISVCLTDLVHHTKEQVETCAADGRWQVKLSPHAAGGTYELTIQGQDSNVTIHNLTYGEVWLAAGQSNMELELQNAQNGDIELSEAHPEIRYYNVVKTPVADESLIEQESYRYWHICENGDFRDMSAVAYYYAKTLAKELQVPIGIVDCYQGGTSISCWLSKENLFSVSQGIPYHESYEEIIRNQTEEEYDALLEDYNNRLSDYYQRVDKLKEDQPDITQEAINEQAGDYPWPPPMGRKSLYRPYGLYYTMMQRILPYTIKGVLYYQGEEDTNKTDRYDVLLEKLIGQYRTDFEDPELTFIDLQLPMFIGKHDVDDCAWGRTRLAQEQAVKRTGNAGLVVLIDLGEYDNVHPVDKKTPGERTAKYVLEHVYGSQEAGTAMELDHVEAEETGIRISFRNTYGGIEVKDNELLDIRHAAVGNDDPNAPIGFEGSEDENDWFPLSAEIDGETIRIQTDNRKISYLRYGYFNYGKVNVYNQAGIPLAPFYVPVDK